MKGVIDMAKKATVKKQTPYKIAKGAANEVNIFDLGMNAQV